jgi:hypothetical protein
MVPNDKNRSAEYPKTAPFKSGIWLKDYAIALVDELENPQHRHDSQMDLETRRVLLQGDAGKVGCDAWLGYNFSLGRGDREAPESCRGCA